MDNYKKYEEVIYRLIEETRSKVNIEDYEPVLLSALTIAWGACKDKSIDFRYNDISEESVNKAINIIERENINLKGAFRTLLSYKIQNKEDEIQLIKNIFKELNNIDDISLEDVKSIINYLILKIDGRKDESIHITPEPIKELMVGMIDPIKGMKVVDYFSGVGSTLLKINEAYGDYNIELYGEEINNEVYFISQILLLVNEVDNYNIINKDVYDFKGVKENNFDYVLMDAPFSLNLNELLLDSKILSYGLPNKTRVDWAGYQLALYSLKETGKAIVTGSTSVLFRLSDENIRKVVIEEDKIETVIKLPSSLYTYTGVSTSIIVFNKNKDVNNKNKIMFIDASEEYVRENRRQNTIPKESIEKIIGCINENKEIDEFSIIVDINTVCENEYNLNSNVYINDKKIKNKLRETKLLGEVAEVIAGVQLTKKDMDILKRNSTHYYLNIKNIGDDEIIYDEEEKIRDKKIDWYGKYDIKAGDIIITTKGTTSKMVVVPDDFKDSFISSNLSIIRVNKDQYNPYVLLKYLKSDVGKLVLEKITSGSGVSVIGANKLKSIEIPDYDISLMKSIGDRIKKNESEYKIKLVELKDNFEIENQSIMKELGIE